MTHSEILRDYPCPDSIEPSDCEGELRLSAIHFPHAGSQLWICTLCDWTIVAQVDDHGERSIHNAFPRPDIPDLRLRTREDLDE